jgi:hypothetical protein
MTRTLERISGFEQGDPFTFIECLQTIYPINGKATPVVSGKKIEITVPDWYGRPWAQNWENFEKGMTKPKEKELITFP